MSEGREEKLPDAMTLDDAIAIVKRAAKEAELTAEQGVGRPRVVLQALALLVDELRVVHGVTIDPEDDGPFAVPPESENAD